MKKSVKNMKQATLSGVKEGLSMGYITLYDKFDFDNNMLYELSQHVKNGMQEIAASEKIDAYIVDWIIKNDHFINFKEKRGIITKEMSDLIDVKLVMKAHAIGHIMYVLHGQYAFNDSDLDLFQKLIVDLQESIDQKYLNYHDIDVTLMSMGIK